MPFAVLRIRIFLDPYIFAPARLLIHSVVKTNKNLIWIHNSLVFTFLQDLLNLLKDPVLSVCKMNHICLGEGESSKTKRPISGSDGLKPSKSSTTMIATPSKQHVKTPSKAKPDPKPQPAAIVRSNAASNDGIEFIKLSKPDRPMAQTSGSKSTTAKHVKSRDPRLSQPSQDLTKAQSVLPQQHSVPSGPIRRLPGPSPDKIRPNTTSRSARPDKNSGGFRPLIEGKRAVMPPPIRKSVSAPTKKLSQVNKK